MDLPELRVESERALEGDSRLVVALQLKQRVAEVVPYLGPLVDRVAEFLLGLRAVVRDDQQAGEVVMSLRPVRADRQRLLVAFKRRLVLPHGGKDVGQVVEGIGVRRVESHGAAQLGAGLIVAPLPRQRGAESGVRRGVGGREFGSLAEVLFGFHQPLRRRVQAGKISVRGDVVGPNRDGAEIGLLGFAEAVAVLQQVAEVRKGVVGGKFEHRVVALLGLLVVAGRSGAWRD